MKKVVVMLLVLSLSFAMAACGKKNEDKANESLGWQKLGDAVFSLDDKVFSYDGKAWKDENYYIGFESNDSVQLDIRATELNKKLTKEKFFDDERGPEYPLDGNYDTLIGNPDIGDKANSYIRISDDEDTKTNDFKLVFTNNDKGYVIAFRENDLKRGKKTLKKLEDSITFNKKYEKGIKLNEYKLQGLCFKLDKKIWHEMTERRKFGHKKDFLEIDKIKPKDPDRQYSDEELLKEFLVYYEIPDDYYENPDDYDVKDFKRKEIRFNGKPGAEISYKREGMNFFVFYVPYEGFGYSFGLASVDKELGKKQFETLKKTIKFEKTGEK